MLISVSTLQILVCCYWSTIKYNRNFMSIWLNDNDQVSLVWDINLHKLIQSSHVIIVSIIDILQLVRIMYCAKMVLLCFLAYFCYFFSNVAFFFAVWPVQITKTVTRSTVIPCCACTNVLTGRFTWKKDFCVSNHGQCGHCAVVKA